MNQIYKILILIWVFQPLSAQQKIVEGIISDSGKTTIEGVLVENPDGTITTKSNNKGHYSITLPDSTLELKFSKPGYIDLLKQIPKSGNLDVTLEFSDILKLSLEELLKVNVRTVNLREQKISEAPGIVSVITKEELTKLGIKTIREALLLVPGFNPLQNDDEQILSVRGIFATTNQKILVMRDGYSLNEANLDIPPTEYSLSIENVKKIEIIRGPGASIYGNSALAAVVNIITIDSDASQLKVQLGDYGQFSFDSYIGVKTKDNGLIQFFGRYTAINGQPFHINVPQINGRKPLNPNYTTFQYPNNYDIGFKIMQKNYSSSFSVRKHQYKTYWSVQGNYTNTDSTLAQPGLQQKNFHYDYTFHPKISENIVVNMQHYIDYGQLTNARLTAPIDTAKYLFGRIQLNEWNVVKLGANYYCSMIISEKGQLLTGISLEQRRYLDSWLASNNNDSSKIIFSRKPFFPKGQELRGAIFAQMNYILTDWMKIDLGARYDIAEKYKSSFDPRVALIFYPFENISMKMIYTKAFQAPGYSYRTSNADYSGSIDLLEPEKLTTYQTSIRYEIGKTSYLELSSYYNRLNNLITRTDKNYYANVGRLASYGVEADYKYNFKNISFFGNYSLLLPDVNYLDQNFKNNNISHNDFKHFPKHSANFGTLTSWGKSLNISAYGQYYSSFLTVQDIKISSRILMNTSILLKNLVNKIDISFTINNLFNKIYKLGDPSILPIEQPGRWFNLGITYNLVEENK